MQLQHTASSRTVNPEFTSTSLASFPCTQCDRSDTCSPPHVYFRDLVTPSGIGLFCVALRIRSLKGLLYVTQTIWGSYDILLAEVPYSFSHILL